MNLDHLRREFSGLPLHEQQRRLSMLRAAVVLMTLGDFSMIDRIIGTSDADQVDAVGVADAVDAWLASGGAA